MEPITQFTDTKFGLQAVVERAAKGIAVKFIDTDADQIIATRVFPDGAEFDPMVRAIAYAKSLITQPE